MTSRKPSRANGSDFAPRGRAHPRLLGDPSRSYVEPIMADAISFGVMVSAFGR